jgi:amino acid adenylation domain-containing protein/FkbM family methyltransferase
MAHEFNATLPEQNPAGFNSMVTTAEPPVHAPKFAHDLFAAQAANQPLKLALVCQGRELTYGELNTRADRLANRLRARGVGANTLVALAAERSLEMVVAILGVLKAGGAYLPLDPAYPRERLDLMMADARPSLLLTQREFVDQFAEDRGATLLIDELEVSLPGVERWKTTATASDLAYVIYTSGSTGKPKGVLLTHGNISHYVTAMARTTGVTAADTYLHTASISFSSSVRQLLLPLSLGASVVIATKDEIRDPVELFTRIKQLGVTVIDIVPSYWRSCVDTLRSLSPATRGALLENDLRLVLSASEPLPANVPHAWRFELGHPAHLINMFGQTETTGIVAAYPVSPHGEGMTGVVPIGSGIDTVRIHLLNPELLPVADGEAGEICVGGPTIGLGYLNHPQLTAAKFPSDPFSLDPNARLYRTGDLGRWRADGTLEFHGRSDNQVKIRGHRVEPAEIESVLLAHPGVRETAVIARAEADGPSRLVAYVVPHQAAAAAIDGHDRYRLPNNMAVVQQNKHETDFFYQQIFVDQTNFKHGITLADDDCVFDVGANIGFFTMFVRQIRANARVYAFEPIPAIFETLKTNVTLYGGDPGKVKLFQCGLAEAKQHVEFTFYPNSTSQSGRYGDEQDEREVLRSIIENVKPEPGNAARPDQRDLDALVQSRVTGERIVCQLRTISEVMSEEGIERIDLLKIDVEKSELDVLAGIKQEDWSKIRQVVIEAHDVNGQLARLVQLLRDHGFLVVAEQDEYLRGSNLYNVYATRTAPANGAPVAPYSMPVLPDVLLTTNELRRHLQASLPDYLVPAELVLRESLPRLPNGKVDRAALQSWEREQAATREATAPLSPVEEQLARIWAEVLKRDSVGSSDNFFDLGGDSILVMQIVSRAARAGVRLTPKLIFKHQTIAELAAICDVEFKQDSLGQRTQ